MPRSDDAFIDRKKIVPAVPDADPKGLNTDVQLTMGMLFYRDADRTPHHCLFQFNPTELERSRNVAFTRSPTGNTLEEPRVGGRNSAKRKQTRKPEPWTMSVTLRFDAGYGMVAWTRESQVREPGESGGPPTELPTNQAANDPAANPLTATFGQEITRIQNTLDFFEALVAPARWLPENETVGDADETPPPPYVMLAFGERVWQCAVKSVRIKEEDYTPDLYPRRFEATLSLEIIQTVAQNDKKPGTNR